MSSASEKRILILAPTARDAALTSEILRAKDIECAACRDVDEVIGGMKEGAAALLLAEEIVSKSGFALLADVLAQQPPWSDLPVLLITGEGADSPAVAKALESLSNLTLIERPTRVTALASAVQTALKARERQYQARDYLEERERTAEALREADRRKDEFLATLAHELRNPLAPIRNSVQLLRMSTGNDPTAERVCEIMERQVDHMVRLIDDLMEVSRITRGLIELRREETDLTTILREAVETSQPLVEAGRHQLAISLPPDVIPIFGDNVRLGQVFANLLNNAAKYTTAGGQIWLSARRDGGEAVISVRDNGIGLSSDKLSVVFDMFMQVDRSASRSYGGLGIGLTLVKSLVELHGGRVLARSDGPDQGSEFIVRLPIAARRDSLSTRPLAVRKASSAGVHRRVLVVDDNQDAAASMAMLLRLLGTDVEVVNGGPTALASVDSFSPDIILLDIGMPDMDGFEVARRIRQRSELNHILLIALTGWGQAEDQDRSRAAGFDHHLVKPADITALQSLLGAKTTRSRLHLCARCRLLSASTWSDYAPEADVGRTKYTLK
jgi:signal transduction histidine kinase/ActR/RegA family two-component response regulator